MTALALAATRAVWEHEARGRTVAERGAPAGHLRYAPLSDREERRLRQLLRRTAWRVKGLFLLLRAAAAALYVLGCLGLRF